MDVRGARGDTSWRDLGGMVHKIRVVICDGPIDKMSGNLNTENDARGHKVITDVM